MDYTILDADAHMSEPPTLWTERIEKRYIDEAPRVLTEYKGKKGMFWTFEDLVTRLSGGEASKTASTDMERPGGWDPAERLKDMAIDGISAAVLYSTRAFFLFGTQKADLQEACFRVYNDWLAEFCNHKPESFAGLGLISLYNVDNAVKEMQRIRKTGLKGAMIWASPPEDKPLYSSRHYDAVWAAAQDLNLPLSLHTNTRGAHNRAYSVENTGNWGPIYTTMVMQQQWLQDSILQLAFSGAFERFPGLKVICAEGDIAWMPPLMARADKYYASRFRRGHDYELSRLPSEYLRDNVWISFIKDPLGLKVYQLANIEDRVMWSTDYPHPACFFPNSLEVFKKDFVGVPEDHKRKFVHDNVAGLFGFTM